MTGSIKHIFVALGALVLTLSAFVPSASAQCPASAGTLSCSSTVAGEVQNTPSNENITETYSCGSISNLFQDGPEDVYEFTCQADGMVELLITDMQCDLDIYILDSTCDTDAGCIAGSSSASSVDDSVTFMCQAGVTYAVVIELWATSCSPTTYTLSFDVSAGTGCPENCLNGTDDDFDGQIDCMDLDCQADPVCVCMDNDGDGYTAVSCGGSDCNDSSASVNPGASESCNTIDDDCNPGTLDGAGEPWFGQSCDGMDGDLCAEGSYACQAGAQVCTDNTGDNTEQCDGIDNDCNPATADGADENWLNNPCDGADADLCAEGTRICQAGASVCTDTTGDTLDLCDGSDNDCNPGTADGSGEAWWGGSCDGADADLCADGTYQCTGGAQSCSDNPGTGAELCDGIDNDCNPATPDGADDPLFGQSCDGADTDLCAEGVWSCSGGGLVCSDNSGNTLDVCDGVDNDCNAGTADGSGETWFGQTCDGADADLCAEGTQLCVAGAQQCSDASGDNLELCDGVDNDCNAATADGTDEAWSGTACDGADADLCQEGTYACAAGTQTCSDNTGDIVEVCDAADNNCDGTIDEGCTCTHLDQRSCYTGPAPTLGVGLCAAGTQTCLGGAWGPCVGEVTPQPETCDGFDNDCNSAPDDVTQSCYDGPLGTAGSGACQSGVQTCNAGTWSSCVGQVTPSAEVCDGVDNDCNPTTADGADESWYGQTCDGPDLDLCEEGVVVCTMGASLCTDASGDTPEVCDYADNDCDGLADEGLQQVYFADVDLDGYGDPDSPVSACVVPMGYVLDNTDCDDTRIDVSPGAVELCDTIDNDCDPNTLDGADIGWVGMPCDGPDSDACEEGVFSCQAGGQVCGDISDDTIEVCDGVDNDCDGLADAADPDLVDPDADMDGVSACSDCADDDPARFPGNTEICDGLDNDCDGMLQPQEIDGDGDGVSLCEGDCDDTRIDMYPGAQELCDGLDNDCDNAIDKAELTEVFGELVCNYVDDPKGDADGDGINNADELIIGTDPNNPDTDGDGLDDFEETNGGLEDVDSDNDFTIDALDGDDDNDGIPTAREVMDATDVGDGDPDRDGNPNWLDFDADGDGVSDQIEAGPDGGNPVDTDGDGQPDYIDTDSDEDGVADEIDNCRLVANPDQTDSNGDDVGDACSEGGEDCANGMDDNGDGLVDCDDPGCALAQACLLVEECTNGIDDDSNGLTDCADPACPCSEDCSNGMDDDGDGLVDCDDPTCEVSTLCTPEDTSTGESDVMERPAMELEVGTDPSGGAQSDCCTAVRAAGGEREVPWGAVILLGMAGLFVVRRRGR